MIAYIEKRHNSLSYRILSAFIAFTFIFSLVLPPGYAQFIPQTLLNLPAPGAMVPLTNGFTPTLIKGLTIHPENPLEFDFIVEKGQTPLQGKEFNKESMKLVKYFLASLTVPEDQMWVNLSPYENNRIISQNLGATDMGKDMLAQDYILKQLTASLMYPENELGRKFWDRIYKKAREQYGTTEIPMDTFNKVWIMPDKAVVYEHEGSVFVVESHLRVMLDSDYAAQKLDPRSSMIDTREPSSIQHPASSIETSIIKEVILPEIEKEVNTGETFANLRQIYNSMILATWYKKNLRESLLGQVYVDKSKTRGVDLKDPSVNQKIYEQYLEAFKKGVYNYIKEDLDPVTKEIIPRKYFSGGAVGLRESNLTTLYSLPQRQQAEIVTAFREIGNSPDARFQNLKIKLYEIAQANNISEEAMTEIVRGIENTTADEAEELFVGQTASSPLNAKRREMVNKYLQDLSSALRTDERRALSDPGLIGQIDKYTEDDDVFQGILNVLSDVGKAIAARKMMLSDEITVLFPLIFQRSSVNSFAIIQELALLDMAVTATKNYETIKRRLKLYRWVIENESPAEIPGAFGLIKSFVRARSYLSSGDIKTLQQEILANNPPVSPPAADLEKLARRLDIAPKDVDSVLEKYAQAVGEIVDRIPVLLSVSKVRKAVDLFIDPSSRPTDVIIGLIYKQEYTSKKRIDALRGDARKKMVEGSGLGISVDGVGPVADFFRGEKGLENLYGKAVPEDLRGDFRLLRELLATGLPGLTLTRAQISDKTAIRNVIKDTILAASSPVSKEEGARRIDDLFDSLREIGGLRIPEALVKSMQRAGINFSNYYVKGKKIYGNESFVAGENITLWLGWAVVMTKDNLQDMTRDLIERDPDTAGNFLEELGAAIAHFRLVELQEELKQKIEGTRGVIAGIVKKIREKKSRISKLSKEERAELQNENEAWKKALKKKSGLAAVLRDVEKELAELRKRSEHSSSPVGDTDRRYLNVSNLILSRISEDGTLRIKGVSSTDKEGTVVLWDSLKDGTTHSLNYLYMKYLANQLASELQSVGALILPVFSDRGEDIQQFVGINFTSVDTAVITFAQIVERRLKKLRRFYEREVEKGRQIPPGAPFIDRDEIRRNIKTVLHVSPEITGYTHKAGGVADVVASLLKKGGGVGITFLYPVGTLRKQELLDEFPEAGEELWQKLSELGWIKPNEKNIEAQLMAFPEALKDLGEQFSGQVAGARALLQAAKDRYLSENRIRKMERTLPIVLGDPKKGKVFNFNLYEKVTLVQGKRVQVVYLHSPQYSRKLYPKYIRTDETAKEYEESRRLGLVQEMTDPAEIHMYFHQQAFEQAVALSQGALKINQELGIDADVIQAHDWVAGLVPGYMRMDPRFQEKYESVPVVTTIHNLEHQGKFDRNLWYLTGIPVANFSTSPYEYKGAINLMKGQVVYSDEENTVSAKYAQETRTSQFGYGLENILNEKASKGVYRGILNAVDYEVWDPRIDKYLKDLTNKDKEGKNFNYGPQDLAGKALTKAEIQKRFDLPITPDTFLFGAVGRLADQKGFKWIAQAAEDLLSQGADVQFVVLGTGEEEIQKILEGVQLRYPKRFGLKIAFSDELAHLIEAGADTFLMPSKSEPSGLNQMYSLRYGTPPIVRKTGGLADTVEDGVTGFVFEDSTSKALLATMNKALDLFKNNPGQWRTMMLAGMAKEFTWDKAWEQYLDMFTDAKVGRLESARSSSPVLVNQLGDRKLPDENSAKTGRELTAKLRKAQMEKVFPWDLPGRDGFVFTEIWLMESPGAIVAAINEFEKKIPDDDISQATGEALIRWLRQRGVLVYVGWSEVAPPVSSPLLKSFTSQNQAEAELRTQAQGLDLQFGRLEIREWVPTGQERAALTAALGAGIALPAVAVQTPDGEKILSYQPKAGVVAWDPGSYNYEIERMMADLGKIGATLGKAAKVGIMVGNMPMGGGSYDLKAPYLSETPMIVTAKGAYVYDYSQSSIVSLENFDDVGRLFGVFQGYAGKIFVEMLNRRNSDVASDLSDAFEKEYFVARAIDSFKDVIFVGRRVAFPGEGTVRAIASFQRAARTLNFLADQMNITPSSEGGSVKAGIDVRMSATNDAGFPNVDFYIHYGRQGQPWVTEKIDRKMIIGHNAAINENLDKRRYTLQHIIKGEPGQYEATVLVAPRGVDPKPFIGKPELGPWLVWHGDKGGRNASFTIASSPVEENRGQGIGDRVQEIATEAPGGIDLNPALLDLQIKRDGNGVPLPLPMQPIEDMHIEGFLPIIINVTPLTNLPFLLGLADTEQDTEETRPAMKAREPEEISSLN